MRASARVAGTWAAITLGASDRFVERIRLHQRAAGQSPVVRELASMVAGTGITLKLGSVTRVDPHGEIIVDGERVPFDRLVVALGSQVERDRVPGVREHAWTLEPGAAAGRRPRKSAASRTEAKPR